MGSMRTRECIFVLTWGQCRRCVARIVPYLTMGLVDRFRDRKIRVTDECAARTNCPIPWKLIIFSICFENSVGVVGSPHIRVDIGYRLAVLIIVVGKQGRREATIISTAIIPTSSPSSFTSSPRSGIYGYIPTPSP